MHTKLISLFSAATLGAALALGTAAADGGIVDVDTRLNVRTSPSTASAVKTRLWDGQVITLHQKNGDWWYAEYAPGTYGYVSASYVTPLSLQSGTVRTASGALNVRAEASAASTIKDKLPRGEDVLLLGKYGDWYKILYRGNLVGYVSAAYIAVGATDAVTLSLPYMRQTDKVYASLRLPGSGEAISTHGCAVVSLAMTESYRTGKTVTPSNILQSEKFTSTGAIYWPSPYGRGENTLAYLYTKLASGKPCIVHVQKKNGSTHFAVVYGFSGGDLVAKNFKIYDPGTASRTTLADLYAAYPTHVKTLSY